MTGVMPIVVDGEVQRDGRVSVLALGGGLQHGEGLFETLPLVGGHLHFFARHVARLTAGAGELGLLPAPAEKTWLSDIALLAEAAGTDDIAVRLMLLRDGDDVVRIAAGTAGLPSPHRPARVGRASPELDRPRSLPHLKTLNYLVPRRAHAIGAAEGYDDVLFSHEGRILEGTRSTVFAVLGRVLRTASLDTPILPGVTREVILDLAREDGMRVLEKSFSWDDLLRAKEAFLTASLRGVRPIESVCGMPLRQVGGPVTLRLRELYMARVAEEAGPTPCGGQGDSPDWRGGPEFPAQERES